MTRLGEHVTGAVGDRTTDPTEHGSRIGRPGGAPPNWAATPAHLLAPLTPVQVRRLLADADTLEAAADITDADMTDADTPETVAPVDDGSSSSDIGPAATRTAYRRVTLHGSRLDWILETHRLDRLTLVAMRALHDRRYTDKARRGAIDLAIGVEQLRADMTLEHTVPPGGDLPARWISAPPAVRRVAQQALGLRVNNVDLVAIAAKVSLPDEHAADQAVMAALRERLDDVIADCRPAPLRDLDTAQLRWWPQLIKPRPDIAAAQHILKLIRSRCTYYGMPRAPRIPNNRQL